MSFLNKTKITDFQWLISECANYIEIDEQKAIASVKDQLASVKANITPQDWNEIRKLETKWYKSLEKNPDYSVYSDPYYLCDIWVCWALYSNKYIKSLINKTSLIDRSVVDFLGNVNTVVDLGCGFGFTTACLSEIFPSAKIYGTNLSTSFQYKVCQKIAKEYNFDILDTTKGIQNVDLIFASEYFEHFQNSLEHLSEIIAINSPRMLVVANGYNGHAIGHFDNYLYKDKWFTAKETSLNFGKMMRDIGYKKMQTKIWNNRPSVWVKT